MRGRSALLLVVAAGLGCRSLEVDQPVAPPAPHRIGGVATDAAPRDLTAADFGVAPRAPTGEQPEQPAPLPVVAEVPSGSFTQVGYEEPVPGTADMSAGAEHSAGRIVARVAGELVFEREVLEPHVAELARARRELTAAQFDAFREQLVRRALPGVIQRRVVLAEAQEQLDEAILDHLRRAAEDDFQERLRSLLLAFGASTESELDARLRAMGTSLGRLRQAHEDDFIARQFLRHELRDDRTISREELLDAYHAQPQRFRRDGRARWQEIELAHNRFGGRDGAWRAALNAQARLTAGESFAEVARALSTGPTASEGGSWDWTTRGSLADAQLDDALFSLPLGETSAILESPEAFRIIRVLEREEPGIIPFEEAQVELARELREERLQRAIQDYMARLLQGVEVETVYDGS